MSLLSPVSLVNLSWESLFLSLKLAKMIKKKKGSLADPQSSDKKRYPETQSENGWDSLIFKTLISGSELEA